MGNKKVWIFILIPIILVGIFVYIRINSTKIKNISISKLESISTKDVYTLAYKGELNDDIKKELLSYKDQYSFVIYNITSDIEEVKDYTKGKGVEVTTDPVIILFDSHGNNSIIADNKFDYRLEYIKKFLYNYVPTPERHYKLSTGTDFVNMFNSSALTVSVFASDSCTYCTMLEPIVNEVAKEIKYDIYYYNYNRMDEKEYNKIMDLDAEIPKECTTDNKGTTFTKGFAKPMTLITKNSKVVGCIKGYYEHDVYLSKLKELLGGK